MDMVIQLVQSKRVREHIKICNLRQSHLLLVNQQLLSLSGPFMLPQSLLMFQLLRDLAVQSIQHVPHIVKGTQRLFWLGTDHFNITAFLLFSFLQLLLFICFFLLQLNRVFF